MLEVQEISTFYGTIQALHGVSLTVNQGEIVTLIGGNGAGKTTTLNTISGLLKAVEGRVLFEGNTHSNLRASGGSVRLDGEVHGDAEVRAEELLIGQTINTNIGWHQDRTYWQEWDDGSELFTAWIALSDVTAEAAKCCASSTPRLESTTGSGTARQYPCVPYGWYRPHRRTRGPKPHPRLHRP